MIPSFKKRPTHSGDWLWSCPQAGTDTFLQRWYEYRFCYLVVSLIFYSEMIITLYFKYISNTKSYMRTNWATSGDHRLYCSPLVREHANKWEHFQDISCTRVLCVNNNFFFCLIRAHIWNAHKRTNASWSVLIYLRPFRNCALQAVNSPPKELYVLKCSSSCQLYRSDIHVKASSAKQTVSFGTRFTESWRKETWPATARSVSHLHNCTSTGP